MTPTDPPLPRPGNRADPRGPTPAATLPEGGSAREPVAHPGDREVLELLAAHEGIELRLDVIRRELDGPLLGDLLRQARIRRGVDAAAMLGEVLHHVEQGLRSLKMLEAELLRELNVPPAAFTLEGLPTLPPAMARFLEERAESPGFTCEVGQDSIRGWVIRWKEYTAQGTVRGAGQVHERPYAWLDG
jgi:hypothetical protein